MPVTEVPPLVSRDSGSRARRPVRITRLVMVQVLRCAKPETIPGLRTSQGNRAWEDCTAGRARAQGKRLFEGWCGQAAQLPTRPEDKGVAGLSWPGSGLL